MQITSGHIYNYRSIKDLQIDFDTNGIHALIGPPGSGKSSFLGALGFALYGDPGPGIDLIDLRHDKADDKELAGADVTWRHGQDTYRTVREMRRGNRGGKPVEKTSARMWRNGVEIEGMSPTLMTSEVTKVLGMSGRAFRGANMIAQGEVDALATATPTEVAALVEEHTGVSQVTKLREQARKSANDRQAVADGTVGSPEAVTTAEELEMEAGKVFGEAEAAHGAADAKAKRARRDWEECNARAHELRTAERSAQQSRDAVVAAKALADNARDRWERLHVTVTDRNLSGVDPDQLQHRITGLQTSLRRITEAGASLAGAAEAVAAAITDTARAQKAADSFDVVAAQSRLERAETELAAVVESIRTANGNEVAARKDAATLTKSLHTLRQSIGQAHCPTCRQSINDLDALITDLEAKLTVAQSAEAKAVEQAAALAAKRREIDAQVASARQELTGAEQAEHHAEQVRERGEAAFQNETEKLDALVELLASLDNDIAPELTDRTNVQSCLQAARVVHGTVDSRSTELRAEHRLLIDEHKAAHDLQAANGAVDNAESAIVDAPDPQIVHAAETAASDARTRLDEAERTVSEAWAVLSSARTGLAQVANEADIARDQWARKCEALRVAEVARGVADALTALRSDLLAECTQQISEAATELLQRFGGEHVAFHLGTDFVPCVELADGRLRKTKLLSGGEKARAGLAFRLGISMQVTDGGLPDQIFGDEITQYLDDEGRRAIVETISDLFAAPILISHTDEVLDYATTVHQLNRNPLGVTELLPLAS